MRTLLRLVALLVVIGSSLALQAGSAQALSCVSPEDWYPKAAHVFVGRITDVRGDTMQVEVSEVWQGEDLAPQVWLERETGMDMWFPFSSNGSVPDGYSSPTEYVIATQDDFVVSPCGMWARSEPMEYGVAGERSPRPPLASGNPGAEPDERSLVPVAAGGVGLVGVTGLAALLWRRRTH